jgi:hypothetical protein
LNEEKPKSIFLKLEIDYIPSATLILDIISVQMKDSFYQFANVVFVKCIRLRDFTIFIVTLEPIKLIYLLTNNKWSQIEIEITNWFQDFWCLFRAAFAAPRALATVADYLFNAC